MKNVGKTRLETSVFLLHVPCEFRLGFPCMKEMKEGGFLKSDSPEGIVHF